MTPSPDDRTDQVADSASSSEKKTPARKTPAKKTPARRTPSRSADENAAPTVDMVAEPVVKPAAAARTTPTAAAARAAAAKNSARTAASKSTSTGKADGPRVAAPKKSPAGTSKDAAAGGVPKTAAAKSAAEKSAAAKTAARTTAARTAAARSAAAKKAAATRAANAAAAKAAAEAAEAERKATEASEKEKASARADDAHPQDAVAAPPAIEAEPAPTELAAESIQPEPAQTEIVEDPAPIELAVEPAPIEPEPAAPEDESENVDDPPARGDEEAAPDQVASVEETQVASVEETQASVEDAVDPVEAAEPSVVPVVAAPDADADAVPEGKGAVEPPVDPGTEAVRIRGLVKSFGDHTAVNGIDLTIPAGSFYGIVGPNGAGKTTTLSIVAGLLRSDGGSVVVCGIDQAAKPLAAKRMMGVLPDRLRTFDRLTGRQLLYYYGLLRGLASDVIEKRVGDLARAFDLGDALGRVVSDYSAGMTKKIMLAGAMIHSPRVLVLDEPFEAVDPVSSAVILDILRAYVAHGGTVILSSHGMDLVERVCSRVAIIVGGDVLAEGTIDEVRAGQTLEARFVELSGGIGEVEGLEWLHTFSD
ncbi:ABC transporter ATP-binding protein [Microbacterium sp. 1.5R]|uniref:ABC transporter ATP-binding protein n=1 Tax=Microbacterium sp. 1.5R TaxID=1916917 RepID=UPI0021B212F0|nr:ATP-binding cassette domain-containing protein [Microbacterium sp. 1.5R]